MRSNVCPDCGNPVRHVNEGATRCLKERNGKCVEPKKKAKGLK